MHGIQLALFKMLEGADRGSKPDGGSRIGIQATDQCVNLLQRTVIGLGKRQVGRERIVLQLNCVILLAHIHNLL